MNEELTHHVVSARLTEHGQPRKHVLTEDGKKTLCNRSTDHMVACQEATWCPTCHAIGRRKGFI